MIKNKKITIILLLVIGTMALVSLAQGVRNASVYSFDFQWDASRILLNGENPYQIFINGIKAETDAEVGIGRMTPNQFPSCLMLLWPFALFNFAAAKYLCLLIIGTPWRNGLGIGQHALFSITFFMLSIMFSNRKKTIVSGIFLAVSLFKYTFTLFLLPYYIYKKRYREILIAGGIHVVMTIVAAIWLGESPVTLIKQSLIVSARLETSGFIDFFAVSSILNINSDIYIYTFSALLFCFIIFIAYRKSKLSFLHNTDKDLVFLCSLSLLSLIMVYHRSYDHIILIILAVYVAHQISNHSGNIKKILKEPLAILFPSVLCLIWFGNKIREMLIEKIGLEQTVVPAVTILSFSLIYYCVTIYSFKRVLTEKESRGKEIV